MKMAVLAAALIIAGLLFAPWLVSQAAGHRSRTCTHTTTTTEHWKVVMFATYGNLHRVHDHGYRHYFRSGPNPEWHWVHNRVRIGCPAHSR